MSATKQAVLSLTSVRDTSLDQNRQSQSVEGTLARKVSSPASIVNSRFSVPESDLASKFCTDAWAIRHALVNDETGELIPLSCGRYACLHCGPRRVAVWRDLVEYAKPERFITLSSMAPTLVEASDVLTRVVRRLRRNGYQFQYLATFEQHKNGKFHAHLLQHGDFIPQSFLCDALKTATHGRSFVTHIARAKPDTAGYVTKYVTKSLMGSAIGRKDDGTKARPNRIRYSREFFPAPTAILRAARRDEWVDTLRSRGELVDDSDQVGKWNLIEQYELPRFPGGRVDRVAADQQYQHLISVRAASIEGEARKSRGERLVLSYMLRENGGNDD